MLHLKTPVCIIGAGPAGAATALHLSYLGIPCVVIDKSEFPRDKICGDAVSGKVTTILNRLDPAIIQRFNAQATQVDVWGIHFTAPSGQPLDFPFKLGYVRQPGASPGYVSKRLDFDNFLVSELRRRDNITLITGQAIEQHERTAAGWRVSDEAGELVVDTPLLVVANGAHSAFSRKVAGLEKDNGHHAGAVRAYYKGVTGMQKDNFIELHFLKELTPGYFWIFPLPNGEANVGLGMRSDVIKKRGVNLRKELLHIVAAHPRFKARFANAEPLEAPVGYGLPLGSKVRRLSGDHYMLVGDAAHLIDPLTGEGIGGAFYSGFIAAEQARDSIAAGDFSAQALLAYDVRIARVLGTEMKLSYRLQQLMGYPRLVNVLAVLIARNQRFVEAFAAMIDDFELRKQLVRPSFWIKTMLKR